MLYPKKNHSDHPRACVSCIVYIRIRAAVAVRAGHAVGWLSSLCIDIYIYIYTYQYTPSSFLPRKTYGARTIMLMTRARLIWIPGVLLKISIS